MRSIAYLGLNDARILAALRTAAAKDLSREARAWAKAALETLERGQPPAEAPWPGDGLNEKPAWRPTLDFVIGFFGWFVLNGLMYAVMVSPWGRSARIGFAVPLFVNVAALILLAFTRREMAAGALWAFGVSLALVAIVALFVLVICFTYLR